jgi:protein-L-isoaspartate(D-aspartate) O-methyltransferase
MVEVLLAEGMVSDSRVLEAMAKVPRETFVPHFWSLPGPLQTGAPEDVMEWHVDRADPDGSVLDLVYDINRALAIRRGPNTHGATAGAGVTSTASAPRLVAAMLELLELAPGMRVLEIGTGSGYNAALLREMVGANGSVCSVDIDAELLALATGRLAGAGYGDVHTEVADGHFGLRGPFDRVVATVGCVDLSSAWLAQLAPGGFCLVALEHGGWHPLTRAEPSPEGAKGTVVGRSGFVGIQGHQAGRSPWPRAGRLAPGPAVKWTPLPEPLAAELSSEPGREAIGGRRLFDLAYLLAMEDRRTAYMLSLAEANSSAVIDSPGGRIGRAGPAGEALQDRLLETAELWRQLGRPTVHDYASNFNPAGPEVPLTGEQEGGVRWVIERLDFHQEVRLKPRC